MVNPRANTLLLGFKFNNNNNNNNNNNKLQKGCRPVAVVIMHVHEYEIRT